MAKLEQLLSAVPDAELKAELEAEVAALKGRMRFGLVYERHLPETVIVGDVDGLKVGDHVRPRTAAHNGHDYRVVDLNGSKATLIEKNGASTNGDTIEVPLDDLLAVKPFGEPTYLGLSSLGSLQRSETRPSHAVINGENFHSLRLLALAYAGEVDCIYIDPPYNTGARDWTYNNRYVDLNDTYRHSKWLSMMEKRLKLARRLLKDDGVLVVTADEHEVHHLGVLLETLFGDARRQLVTIVNNAAGVSQGGLWRVEEYAFFSWLGSSKPIAIDDDLLSDESKRKKTVLWFSLVRAGGVNATPARRRGLVFPIAIDPERNRIVGVGRTLKERVDAGEVSGDLNAWRPDPDETVDGYPVVWPYSPEGSLHTWQLSPPSVLATAERGFIRVRPYDGAGGNKWSLSYVRSGHQKRVLAGEIPHQGREPDGGPYILGDPEKSVVPKTVWKRARHDAGKWGSRTLRELLDDVSFDYAKSPYAVLDALRTIVGDNPDALILDFFAGSGTTLHSTCLLNAEDDGRRRCILVTNNEVDADKRRLLERQGHLRGTPDYERHGVFEAVTRPRCEAVITGKRDGKAIAGSHLHGRPYAEGFEENVEFFRLDYLDADEVELGRCFAFVHPLLWLAAGGRGARPADGAGDYMLAPESGYAVLFNEDAFREFEEALADADGISHAALVTESDEAYAEMRERLGAGVRTTMLYRDFLRHFRRRLPA